MKNYKTLRLGTRVVAEKKYIGEITKEFEDGRFEVGFFAANRAGKQYGLFDPEDLQIIEDFPPNMDKYR